MKNTHYLRIESVNLSRFVFDTRDLSTVRGGGLMLLDAVEKAKAALAYFTRAEPDEITVSEGASIGLFKFSIPDGKKSADAVTIVRDKLTVDFPHATFVVDVVESKGEAAFRTDAERLLALNRWQQMQTATIMPPGAEQESPEMAPACEYDGIRPARKSLPGRKRKKTDGNEEDTFLSRATHSRAARGRKAKQAFYEKHLRKAELAPVKLQHDFANEFEQIAARQSARPLAGKLAVFYADGNAFAATQARLCTTAGKQRAWDKLIRGSRARFLRDFLDQELAPASGDEWLSKENLYRFETLLWGGDEVLFVMPAWQGWRFAARFFAATKDWNTQSAGLDAQALTHTAALVFCQHHAPIHRVKDLAKEKMAESAKALKGGRERNQLVYQVLESMDHLGSDYAAGVKKRYCEKLEHSALVLYGGLDSSLGEIAAQVGALKASDFPRSQLRALVTGWLRNGAPYDDTAKKPLSFDQIATHLTRTAPAAATHLKTLSQHLGDGLPLWVHLEELWDYAAP